MPGGLCGDRREGFGPQSSLYPNLTTACFNDVILVPLATWIYFLLVPILFFAYPRTRRPNEPSHIHSYEKHGTNRRRRLCKDVAYAILIICIFGMTILEVARLEIAHLGIGLLPFEWPAFLLAATLRFTRGIQGRFSTYWWANVFLWVALVAMNSVRIAEMVEERGSPRYGEKYPIDDQITDVAVYLALYVVAIPLEWWR